MIADRAEHLDLPASEIIRKLTYGELYSVFDIGHWFQPFYWDPKTFKWYFDNDEVFSYTTLINDLNKTYRAHKANGSHL